MAIDELMKMLNSLNVSVDGTQIVYCHNPSKDACDGYVFESDSFYCIGKNDAAISIKEIGGNESLETSKDDDR